MTLSEGRAMVGTRGWRIGSFGGVEIRIAPSWIFIAALIGYTFYVVLAVELGGLEPGGLVAWATLMTAAFFASVLLHELAHAWMARARGVEVRGITLFLFGGATQADLDTGDPNDEFAISAVGPVTSLALAGVLWAVAVSAGPSTLGFVAGRLGWINLALGIFNLLPGLPLDGGRLLRSFVWHSTGDLVKATRTAARAGEMLGHGLVALGIAQLFFMGALIGGLWFMAIGWFLLRSAQASFQQLQIKQLLSDVPAWQVMSPDLVAIDAGLSVRRAVDEYFMRYRFSAFPVVRDTDTTGIVTLNAISGVPQEVWDATLVGDVAEPLAANTTVGRSDPMTDVLERLTSNDSHRVVVVDGSSVVGIITTGDLTRWIERSQSLGLVRMAS